MRSTLARSLLAARSATTQQQAVNQITRSLAAKPSWNKFLASRSFITSPFRSQATTTTTSASESKQSSTPATTTATAPASSFSEIVQRFGGWYPLIGLSSLIIFSKEFIVLNEEFLLVSNFATCAAILYVSLGDVITKAAEEEKAVRAAKRDDISDFIIERIESKVRQFEVSIAEVDVLKSLKDEYARLSTELVTAKTNKARYEATQEVLKKLNETRSREQTEAANLKEEVANKATQFVRESIAKLPTQQKLQMIEQAIAVLEGKKATKDNTVARLYNDYLKKGSRK